MLLLYVKTVSEEERKREHQADMECSNYIFVISPYTAHMIRHLSTERIAEMKKEPTSISRKIFLSSDFFLLKGWQYALLIIMSADYRKHGLKKFKLKFFNNLNFNLIVTG